MLKLKLIGWARDSFEDAMDMARDGGKIVATRYKELNDDLFVEIPSQEVSLWVDLFDKLAEDAEDVKEGDQFQKLADKISEAEEEMKELGKA